MILLPRLCREYRDIFATVAVDSVLTKTSLLLGSFHFISGQIYHLYGKLQVVWFTMKISSHPPPHSHILSSAIRALMIHVI